MKKIFLGIAILVLLGLTAILGLLDATFCYDDISEQEYQISLKKAGTIFKDATNQTEVQTIQFSPQEHIESPTNNTFEYLFIGADKEVAINPTTGKTTIHSLKQREYKNKPTFNVGQISLIKLPKIAIKEAIKQCGQKNVKAKSWSLLTKKGKLYYEIKLSEDKETHTLLIDA